MSSPCDVFYAVQLIQSKILLLGTYTLIHSYKTASFSRQIQTHTTRSNERHREREVKNWYLGSVLVKLLQGEVF